MTNADRILAFLQSISPADASNADIVARTGIKPHQQVFAITRQLMQSGRINGLQAGHEWRFWWGARDRQNPTQLPTRSDANPHRTVGDAYSWDTANSLDCRLGMTWVPIGRVILSDRRVEFPAAQSVPALYRFRFRNPASEALYIGETENLARRFTLYRNPGPSQQTNLRLNGKFRDALSSGAEIAVAVVITSAWIEMGGSRTLADFSARAMCRLFENAAIIEGLGVSVESLNR